MLLKLVERKMAKCEKIIGLKLVRYTTLLSKKNGCL